MARSVLLPGTDTDRGMLAIMRGSDHSLTLPLICLNFLYIHVEFSTNFEREETNENNVQGDIT